MPVTGHPGVYLGESSIILLNNPDPFLNHHSVHINNARKRLIGLVLTTHAVYPRAGGEIRRPTWKSSLLIIGVDMDTLFIMSYLRAQIGRVLIAFFVFLLLRKYILPMIAREVKIDLLIIIILLYLLFLASFKIWPVW